MINSAHQRFGGAVQVALSFIHEARRFSEIDFVVIVGPGLRASIKKDQFPANFTFEYLDFGTLNFRKTIAINKTLRLLEKEHKPNVIISTTGPTYFNSKAPQIIGFNLPLYIYPESPYLKEQNGYRRFRLFLKRAFHFFYFKRDASAYVTQTEDVNQRVRKVLKTRNVHTVTNNASSLYTNWKTLPNKLPKRKPNEFRFICVSAYYRHKNLEIIPEIIRILRERGVHNIRFVLTLNENDLAKYIGDFPEILNVGPVKPDECPSLYSECDALFLPTLAECFSASYPEAMIMKKPIITTDLGFARSICGKAALFFEPKEPNHASTQIIKMIESESLRNEMVKLGMEQLNQFDSPKSRAQKYIDLCTQIANQTFN
ncbi:MAG: glycosyltransferase family 4 protein [Salibacteraceae bacterium]